MAFAPQTKTTLENGFYPKFADGDSILISNGNALDTCEVKGETISTDLTGPLTAVYPYKAAKMNENNENRIDTVLVSTEQSGLFADANICMAVMENENDEVLSFKNKTALFCIKPPTGSPGYVEVIAAAGFNIANNIPTGSTHTSLDTIHVATTTADSVYVSILVPGNLTIGDLSFSDGTKVKTITEGEKASATVTLNTLYTVNGDNWAAPAPEVECVVIGGKKWATMNLGATSVTDYGDLYSWGETSAKADYSSSCYSSTAQAISPDIAPDSGNDVARVKLGGSWRLPTKADFTALANDCKSEGYASGIFAPSSATTAVGVSSKGIYWCSNYSGTDGKTGLLFCDGTNKLFFPAAGYSDSDSRSSGGDYGYYWSSTWFSSDGAYDLYFFSSNVRPQDYDIRYFGRSVRPVSD